jgi:hypothetical protein
MLENQSADSIEDHAITRNYFARISLSRGSRLLFRCHVRA